MMILTAKVDFKKIMLILVAVAAVLLTLILIFGNRSEASATTSGSLSANDSRVKFLEGFGWEVTPAPKESTQVKIPDETSELISQLKEV